MGAARPPRRSATATRVRGGDHRSAADRGSRGASSPVGEPPPPLPVRTSLLSSLFLRKQEMPDMYRTYRYITALLGRWRATGVPHMKSNRQLSLSVSLWLLFAMCLL